MTVAVLTCHPAVAKEPPPTLEARVDYYAKKIAADPKLYPVYVQLAAAYFDQARETNDPAPLAKAEEALRRSVEIQPNLPAYATLSALCNYRHRFKEAVDWGRKVLESEPNDSAVIAGMIEAHLALGRDKDAERLLSGRSDGTGDFHLAAAHGVFLKATDKPNEAAAAFTRAAGAAAAQKAPELAAWGWVQVAGVWIDRGDVDRAIPFLEKAAQLAPDHVELKIHQAEVYEARGQFAAALAVYEGLLARGDDPAIRAKAFELAKKLGEGTRVQAHFDAAERGFKRAIEAGEFYTLGALARLYLAADVRLAEALQLAKRNAEHQEDESARQLVETIQRKLSAKPD